MPFNRPTLQEIADRIESDILSRIDGASTILRRSVLKILARVLAGSEHLLYEYLQYSKDQLFVLTADTENLERHGTEYGIFRTIGTRATGTVTVSGTVGTSVPAGTELISSTNNLYRFATAVTIGAGGTGTGSIEAKDYGTSFNEDANAQMTLLQPITGIVSTVTVDANGITGGTTEETDADYRKRILNRKRQPPHGGAAKDYVTWAKEIDGVTRAWLIEKYQGIGTLGLVFMRDDDGDGGFPDSTERDAVYNYIVSHTDASTGKTVGIPVTAKPGFYMIEAQPKTVDFTIQLDPNTTAVQSTVTTKLTNLITEKGGPEQTISISEMYEVVTAAIGEVRSRITLPSDDVTAGVDEVHVMGTITFEEYS